MAFKGRKASLELSIRAIVIVVLAMTLLGLGLGFIKNMFSNISDLTETTFDKIAEQLQTDLITNDKKLAFSQSTVTVTRGKHILLGWGLKNENPDTLNYFPIFRAIKCPIGSDESEKCPKDELSSNAPNSPTGSRSHPRGLNAFSDLNEKWFTFKYSGIIEGITPNALPVTDCGNDKKAICYGIPLTADLYTVGPADIDIRSVDLTVPKTAQPGLYLIEFGIYDYNDIDLASTPESNELLYASTEIFLTVG